MILDVFSWEKGRQLRFEGIIEDSNAYTVQPRLTVARLNGERG